MDKNLSERRTRLIPPLRAASLPLHRGEADVELLDDRWIQAVEVEQQDELIVETWRTETEIDSSKGFLYG